MASRDTVFAGSVPEIYDTYMVPLIFQSYAADLARHVASGSPRNVLETAAGTGVVSRALAPLLGPDASYIVTDLNQPMLDRARKRQGEDQRIVWRQANAMELPFDSGSFDAECCQFGAMFFPDKVAGFSEARRVLRKGGRFVFNVWDRIAENEFAEIITNTAAGFFPDDPPLFLARTPHGYHDVGVIRDDLRKAGFSDVAITTVTETSTAPSPKHAAVAYCQGTPLRNEIEARDASLLDAITDRAAHAVGERFGQGTVSGRIQAHVVVAIA